MSAITDNDLKRLEDLINSRFNTLEAELKEVKGQIAGVQKEVTDLRISISKVEGSLQNQQQFVQKIPDLAEKVGELKNWRQIVIITLTALISGSITWVIRGGNIKP